MGDDPVVRPRVGVRELRQNLSVYLRRVKDGESLEVTEQGRPVQQVALGSRRASILDHLCQPATLVSRQGDEAFDRPPLKLGSGPSVVDVLVEMRDEDER